jgi:hypothetical protein
VLPRTSAKQTQTFPSSEWKHINRYQDMILHIHFTHFILREEKILRAFEDG